MRFRGHGFHAIRSGMQRLSSRALRAALPLYGQNVNGTALLTKEIVPPSSST
jgi:hypothetical protein